jgi:hypothetical protein
MVSTSGHNADAMKLPGAHPAFSSLKGAGILTSVKDDDDPL